MLLADGLVGPRKKSDELSDTIVRGMLDGLAIKVPALPSGTWVGPQRSFSFGLSMSDRSASRRNTTV
jgi:hypothetical protein